MENRAPTILKVIVVVYVLADVLMGASAAGCLLLGLGQCRSGYVSGAFLSLPYQLQAQVGMLFISVSAAGIAVSFGLWRMRRWAADLFILLTAVEVAAVAAYVYTLWRMSLPVNAPALILVDILAAAYVISIRNMLR